jgi:two-component system cell cycle response regulator
MNKPLVYVVDDNKITVKLMRRYLEVNGYEVGEAYDGVECLEKVKERIPDVIVLDVMMPRLDGYETVKRLKSDSKTKEIPVVIVTALNDVSNQLKAVDSGADDFLSKPIEEKLLIAKVKLLSALSFSKKREKLLRQIVVSLQTGYSDFKNKPIDEILKNEGLI